MVPSPRPSAPQKTGWGWRGRRAWCHPGWVRPAVRLLLAVVGLASVFAACADRNQAAAGARGPGFAEDGAVPGARSVYLYRVRLSAERRDAVVLQLHPETAEATVSVRKATAGARLQACRADTGFDESLVASAKDCVAIVADGRTRISLAAGGHTGLAILNLSTERVSVEEVVVEYTAVDGFLAVEFAP